MKALRRDITLGMMAFASLSSCQRTHSEESGIPQPVPAVESKLPAQAWRKLTEGIEFGRFPVPGGGDRELWIVRIDARTAPLKSLSCSNLGHGPLTADQWAAKHKLSVVINAGMFENDHVSHIGYWKSHGETLRAETRKDYSSFAAFGARDATLPAFHIFDSDASDIEKEVLPIYQDVVQNLRLVKRPAENRWKPQDRAWSEAALGEDDAGHALFIFCPVGLTMHDFNEHLLKLPIHLVAAQHLEGGPEASLYVKIGDFEIRGIGSYETGFNENDNNHQFWPIPNVIGVSSPEADRNP